MSSLTEKDLEQLYRLLTLAHLQARVRARSLTDSDWQQLGALLERIVHLKDVRAYYHGHIAQERGAASKRAKESARRRDDRAKITRAAYSLYDGKRCPPLPKVATKAGVPLWRVRHLVTKGELAKLLKASWQTE